MSCWVALAGQGGMGWHKLELCMTGILCMKQCLGSTQVALPAQRQSRYFAACACGAEVCQRVMLGISAHSMPCTWAMALCSPANTRAASRRLTLTHSAKHRSSYARHEYHVCWALMRTDRSWLCFVGLLHEYMAVEGRLFFTVTPFAHSVSLADG